MGYGEERRQSGGIHYARIVTAVTGLALMGVAGVRSSFGVFVQLIPHAADHDFPKMVASGAMGLMGAMNVMGTTASGYICDCYGKRGPLAAYYFPRGLSLFFLLEVKNVAELNLFAIIFGLNYISTVPATSTLTAVLFERRSVGMLFGWSFLSHQVGAALASYIGGLVYDLTGSYNLAFIAAACLGILAAGMVLLIPEPPAAHRSVLRFGRFRSLGVRRRLEPGRSQS